MAGFVNIRRDVDDKFYRYLCVFLLLRPSHCSAFIQSRDMSILLVKTEIKGNGIKTVVLNMSDVAHT
jgi:translation initiation factor 5